MTQIQKKKNDIYGKKLSDEDVNEIVNAIIDVMREARKFYRNVLDIIAEPLNKEVKRDIVNVKQDPMVTEGVYMFLKNYITAHMYVRLYTKGRLPRVVNIVISCETENSTMVKVVADMKTLRYMYEFIKYFDWEIELANFTAGYNVTPKKIFRWLINDVEKLVIDYRWEYSYPGVYEVHLKGVLDWLKLVGKQLSEYEEYKVKETMQIKDRLANAINRAEQILKKYGL
jgi:hypothetical protein